MKTKNNAQKTIDDQVRKMILRGSAVILCLALITLTLNAQDFWKQFSKTGTYEKMAQLMVEQTSETEKADAVFEAIDAEISIKLNHSSAAFACETEREEEAQLESWMIDESNFISTNDFNTIETEEALKVEDWMINNFNFENQLVSGTVDFEMPMKIEAWMTTPEYFGSVKALTIAEPALMVESWMLDNKNFSGKEIQDETIENEPMQLEAWMTDNQYWDF